MKITEELRRFVAANIVDGHLVEGLDDTASLIDAGLMDSLSVLILLVHLQQEYAIVPDPSEVEPERFDSLAAIESFITERRADVVGVV